MDLQTALIGAIGGLWAVLTALTSGALKWLLDDRKTLAADWSARLEAERTECRAEIARRDTKLDGAADLLARQNDSMQKQIDAQSQMIVALQAALSKGPPS